MLQPTKLWTKSKKHFIFKTTPQFGFCALRQGLQFSSLVFWLYRKIGIHATKYSHFCNIWSKTVRAKTTDFALYLLQFNSLEDSNQSASTTALEVGPEKSHLFHSIKSILWALFHFYFWIQVPNTCRFSKQLPDPKLPPPWGRISRRKCTTAVTGKAPQGGAPTVEGAFPRGDRALLSTEQAGMA